MPKREDEPRAGANEQLPARGDHVLDLCAPRMGMPEIGLPGPPNTVCVVHFLWPADTKMEPLTMAGLVTGSLCIAGAVTRGLLALALNLMARGVRE
jgi:hypothetical protein